jgi:Ca-activated chloride channel family protein
MRNFIYIPILFFSLNAFAQGGKNYVREGNKLYKDKRYTDADSLYRLGAKDTSSYKSVFNLGDALYKQGKFEEAANNFNAIAQKKLDNGTRAQAFHNMGNSYLGAKKYQESINAYKNSLRLNPADEDTRYNLSYAQQMLKKEEEQKKKDQDKKDKDKDKDKKDDKGKDKDKKDQDKKDQDQKDKEDKQKEKPQPQQLSKEDAQQILNALANDEKKVQDKLKKKNAKTVKVQVEKDW